MASGSRTSTVGDAERVIVGSVSFSHWSPDGTRILYGDEQKDALMILDLGPVERRRKSTRRRTDRTGSTTEP